MSHANGRLVLDEILQLAHTVVHDLVEGEHDVGVYAEHLAQRVLVLGAVHVAVEQIAHVVQEGRIVLVGGELAGVAQLERLGHRLVARLRLERLLLGQLQRVLVHLVQAFAQQLMVAKEQVPMLVHIEQPIHVFL